MNKTIRCIIIVLLTVSFAVSPLADVLAQSTAPAGLAPLSIGKGTSVPNQYIVVLKPTAAPDVQASAISALEASGGKVIFQYDAALNGFAAVLPDKALLELRQNPQVDYIEADQVVSLEPDPKTGKTAPAEITKNDTVQTESVQTGATWGLDRVDQRALPLNGSYIYRNTGAGVNVYVIDSGIRTTHTQFGGRASKDFDAIGDGENGNDCYGHGTHVAATIGGSTYGVAKSVRLHAVRVFDCYGGATWAGVIAGINWVAAHRIKPAVANMSLGGWYVASVNAAVNAAIAKGVTFAVSAGNNGYLGDYYSNACNYSPASTPAAITVGASEYDDYRAYYSNRGSCVDIFAPGTDVTSAGISSDTAVATHSGTSMASPHVAGVAALYLQSDPTLTPAQVASGLINFSTKNVISDPYSSPNRLLFSQVVAPLVVPTLIAPRASIVDNTPSFSWTKISGATQYQLQLYKGTTLIYLKTVVASTCGTSTYCVSTPTRVLAYSAAYTWKVRAYVSRVWKTFSAAKVFTIIPATIPTVVAPIGTITDSTPTYTWSKIIGAAQYQYQLYKGATLIYTQTVMAANCGATAKCVNAPTTVLPFAAYTWHVRALVSGTWKNFSTTRAFTVIPITVPTPLTPNSSISTMTPTYTWTRVLNAIQYELQLHKGTTLIYTQNVLSTNCGAAANCVNTPRIALPRAIYTWRVRALINGTWKALSATRTFTVSLPRVPTLIMPGGTITDITPAYTWTKIAWATRYQVQLYKGTTLVYSQLVLASACGATANCVSTPTRALPRAAYTWKVRALIDGVWNTFSAARAFTVNPPTIPVIIKPVGTIADATPTYAWAKVAWATSYQYRLYRGTVLVYKRTVLASACGSSANCVNTPAISLPRAKYTWRVSALVGGAWKAFSAPKTFTVNPPTIPTPEKPASSISDTTPSFSWTRIYGATYYQYLLSRGATLVYSKVLTAGACGTAAYCINTPATVLPRAVYTWKVRALVSGTWRTFSAPKTFTIIAPATIPTPIKPSGSISDTTPTFSWSKIVGATQYQYQLYRGTTLVYIKAIASSACGSTAYCLNTPTTVLAHTAYTWRVRAMVGGVWKTFSASKTFKIP